jgi:heme exporter protein B
LSIAKVILELARKDLRVEFRKPQELSSALMFTFGSVLVFGLALDGTSTSVSRAAYAAIIWIILYFASTFVFASSFHSESDQGPIGGLKSLPFSMNVVLYGKALYCLIHLTLVIFTLIVSTMIFLGVGLQLLSTLAILLIFLIGAVGFSLLGCLTSALLMFSEGKRILIVFLLLPVSLPILIPCISATGKIAAGLTLSDILPEMELLVAFDILVFLISYLSFESTLSD